MALARHSRRSRICKRASFDRRAPPADGSNSDSFRSFVQPFPIIVADSFSKHENDSNIFPEEGEDIPLTNPIYEFNVCKSCIAIIYVRSKYDSVEFGSFDPTLAAFTPTKFLGSPNDSVCVTGFDQTSFIEGISSNVFHTENTSVRSPVHIPYIDLFTYSIPEHLTGILANWGRPYIPEHDIPTTRSRAGLCRRAKPVHGPLAVDVYRHERDAAAACRRGALTPRPSRSNHCWSSRAASMS